MSKGTRYVNPLSLMTDVFVELEQLKQNLETLRDELVVHEDNPDHYFYEMSYARRNCRRIDEELRCISSLLALHRKRPPTTPPSKPPPTPLKVIK